ncbi:MAG: hypothetical protein ACLTLY_03590 [Agathobacter rectalis]
MGSGSLLLNAKRYYTDDTKYIKYYGQELMTCLHIIWQE